MSKIFRTDFETVNFYVYGISWAMLFTQVSLLVLLKDIDKKCYLSVKERVSIM